MIPPGKDQTILILALKVLELYWVPVEAWLRGSFDK